jgi:hypothetical protein
MSTVHGCWAVTVTHDGAGVSSWELVPALLAFGLGMGFVFGPLFNVIPAGVDEHEVGSASLSFLLPKDARMEEF